jgi:hypothetical protein
MRHPMRVRTTTVSLYFRDGQHLYPTMLDMVGGRARRPILPAPLHYLPRRSAAQCARPTTSIPHVERLAHNETVTRSPHRRRNEQRRRTAIAAFLLLLAALLATIWPVSAAPIPSPADGRGAGVRACTCPPGQRRPCVVKLTHIDPPVHQCVNIHWHPRVIRGTL